MDFISHTFRRATQRPGRRCVAPGTGPSRKRHFTKTRSHFAVHRAHTHFSATSHAHVWQKAVRDSRPPDPFPRHIPVTQTCLQHRSRKCICMADLRTASALRGQLRRTGPTPHGPQTIPIRRICVSQPRPAPSLPTLTAETHAGIPTRIPRYTKTQPQTQTGRPRTRIGARFRVRFTHA